MPLKVDLETSTISYLTAHPSRDVVVAGHQQTTSEQLCQTQGYVESDGLPNYCQHWCAYALGDGEQGSLSQAG